MKVKLKYDFNNAEDKAEALLLLNASEFSAILFEIKYNLRKKILSKLEHNSKYEKITPEEAVDLVFEEIFELMDNVNSSAI